MSGTRLLRGLMGAGPAIRNAEKLVGYSSIHPGLGNLMNDEFASLAVGLRKLLSTNHPLLDTAKNLLQNGYSHIQLRGLCVLLLARAGNHGLNIKDATTDGVTEKQRTLTEVMETVYSAFMVHQGILDSEQISGKHSQNLILGNKIAVLSGDYLLAHSSKALSKLESPQVTGLVAKSIADMSMAEFFEDPSQEEHSPENRTGAWERKCYLETGSLLSSSCRGVMELVNASESLKDASEKLGIHINLMLAAQGNVSNESREDKIELCRIHGDQILTQLKEFPESIAKESLSKLVVHQCSE